MQVNGPEGYKISFSFYKKDTGFTNILKLIFVYFLTMLTSETRAGEK